MKLTDEEQLFNPFFWQQISRDINPFAQEAFLQRVSIETGVPYERLKRRWRAFLRGEVLAKRFSPGSDTIH